LSEISRRKIVVGEDFWKGKHDQGRRGGDIAHKREIVLHAQEQAMIGRVTVRGLLWTMRRKEKQTSQGEDYCLLLQSRKIA
jgi:hypothetical protein